MYWIFMHCRVWVGVFRSESQEGGGGGGSGLIKNCVCEEGVVSQKVYVFGGGVNNGEWVDQSINVCVGGGG